jgi:spermidine/putrescine-binding protein
MDPEASSPFPPELGSPPPGVYSRRQFLRATGGAVIAVSGMEALLGATGTAFGATRAAEAIGGPLRLFTWQGYDLVKPLAPWRKQHHINQTVKYINNQFDVASILRGPGGKQYDSASVNQAYTHLFQGLGIMDPLTAANVPSLAKMFPFFRNSAIWRWSPHQEKWNSAPWTWGPIGISYLADRVPEPKSWHVLIDPKNKGRVGTFDDAYNNVSVAAIALGFPLTHITPKQLNGPIKEWLLKLKANLKSISPNIGDQQTLLANGEVDFMNLGLTEFTTTNFSAQQGKHKIGFAVPKEGGWSFCDAAFVTPWAPDKKNAYAFLEALLSGRTAAAAGNALYQAVSVPSVVPLLNKQTRALVPYNNLQKYLSTQLKFQVNFTPKPGQGIVNFSDLDKVWQAVKAS